MKLISFDCPSCGAAVHFEEDKKVVFCTSCGRQLMFDDGTMVIKTIDVARLREIELEERKFEAIELEKLQQEQERLAHEKKERYYRKRNAYWLFANIVVHLLIGIVFVNAFMGDKSIHAGKRFGPWFAMYGITPIAMAIAKCFVFPEKPKADSVAQGFIAYVTLLVVSFLMSLFAFMIAR